MAFTLDEKSLCLACQTLTFNALLSGFEHPLAYSHIVSSGRKCPLCRLIICSMGRLQTRSTASEIEKSYDTMIDELLQLPAVYRRSVSGLGHLPVCNQIVRPDYVTWDRCEYQGEAGDFIYELRKGNFDGGETIQVTADQGSWYRATGSVPLDRISGTISKSNFDMLRGWLETCVESHNACRVRDSGKSAGTSHNEIPSGSRLPTRVIDVTCLECSKLRPRLVQTDGRIGTYVALSHRWGNKEFTIQTLSSTLETFQRYLPMESLPNTFRQAIEVTRQLKVRYLWIDSLCIVQDDPDDWRRESQKMGDVFEQCICVIAATDSVDSQGQDHGLFLPRKDPLAVELCIPIDRTPLHALSTKVFKREDQTFVWKYRWPAAHCRFKGWTPKLEPIKAAICLRPRIDSLSCRVRRTAWYSRGWVLQERLLPSRIIYFTKDKLYWSCFTTTREEENSDPAVPHRRCVFQSKIQGMRGISDCWTDILSDYIGCSVTLDRDRLIAISGITRRFEQYYSVDIYAGILDDRTGGNLLWFVYEPTDKAHLGFHAPSWSWASLAGSVSFLLALPCLPEQYPLIRNLQYTTANSCPIDNPGGFCGNTCLSGQVSFVGPLGKLTRSSKSIVDVKVEGLQGDPINNDEIMRFLLGSAVFRCSTLKSYDNKWNEIPVQRNLFVPAHTELLTDSGEVYFLGFLIPDCVRTPITNKTIFCAAIQQWRGNKAESNCEIDFIGLEKLENKLGVYRRIGRGRIICNEWLSTCREETIFII